MKSTFSILLVLCLAINISSAQIFDRVLDKAANRLSDKIEDKIAEAIYKEIEKKAMRSIDNAMDNILKERYEQDSINGKTGSADYGSFLNTFLTPVDLPASYNFDMVLEAKTKDYDGKKNKMEMMLTEDGSLMGMKTFENDQEAMIVFDMNNDVMATFTTKDGKKQVVAIANVLSLGGAMIKANIDEEDMEMTFEKTGKTKKVVGYNCEEWKMEDEKTVTKAFIAEDFPISWKESHNSFLKNMMPAISRDNMPNGMALKSETKTKKKSKKTTFEVTKVIESGMKIDVTKYEKVDYSNTEE